MRLITTKDANTPPPSLVGAKAEQERIAIHQDLGSISEKIYKGEKITINDINDPYYGEEEYDVRYQLRRLFYNKCAYCERIEYKPDVEHYRPKKKVTGSQRNNHGYFWLCYEWTNLLPACRDCNSGNGKWNKFPVANNRVTTAPLTALGKLDFDRCKANSTYLKNESPLLLHPEIDEPTNLLKLEWNGKLTALDGDRKGLVSIDIYDLNRGNLIKARKEIIDNFKEGILFILDGFRQGYIEATFLQEFLKIYLAGFESKAIISTPYSFVVFYICKHFQTFVNENFPNFSDIEIQLLIESFPTIT